MFKKVCTNCKQPSFSSSERGKWLCPVCNQDITYVLHQNAEKQKVSQVEFESFKNRFTVRQVEAESLNKFV